MTEPTTNADAATLEKMFIEELVGLQCKEVGRVPIGVAGVSAVMAYGAWSHLHPIAPIAWFSVVIALLIVRMSIVKKYFAAAISPLVMQEWLERFSHFNGWAMGVGVFAFMHWYSLQWQAIATIFSLALVAGALPASAFIHKHFKNYSLAIIICLALGWAFFGKTDERVLSFMIALLCVAYLFVFTSFIKDAEAKAKQGFFIRYENVRLLEEIKAQQVEITRERDIAQKANLAKSRFLASASHDLRQPLQTIAMYNAALSLRPLDEQSSQLVRSAGVATSSLTSLLNALLDVSQLDTNAITAKISSVDLFALSQKLDQEFSQLAQHKDRRFTTAVPTKLTVTADPLLLERVLRNLLDNAFKHGAKSIVALNAHALGTGRVKIEICDDGPGIPESEFETIFEEFYQLKNPERDRAQGLGLGLPIVRRVCQLMGATCTVESRLNETKFILEFARAEEVDTPMPEVNRSLTASPILQGKKVMVFDDEAQVRDSLKALLEGWGCEVRTTGEQRAAVAFLGSESYMVLLIDYRLRDGHNGLGFVTTFAELLGQTATILITGDATDAVTHQAEALGVPVMRKPIDAAELRRTLEDIATP
jgi:signal transduction histidine kinase/CheY-like chemotaxis protein